MAATTAHGPDDHRQACAYFLAGIRAGVLPCESAKDWADGVIAAMDHPPIAIIEVAVANGREACLEALACCARVEDDDAAGRALMADNANRLRSGGIGPEDALALADRVAEVTRMPLDVTLDLHALRPERAVGDFRTLRPRRAFASLRRQRHGAGLPQQGDVHAPARDHDRSAPRPCRRGAPDSRPVRGLRDAARTAGAGR